jgi:hypothetical protein
MKGKQAVPILVAIGTALLMPAVVWAASGGLVPCGTIDGNFCGACDLVALVQRVISFLIGLSIPIAVLMFAWAGVLYFTSGATGEKKITQARGIFKTTFIGFVITISAWLVINTLLSAVLNPKIYSNSSWFKIDCSTAGPRLMDTHIGDVLNNTLGVVQSSIQADFSNPICQNGGSYSDKKELCVDASGITSNPFYLPSVSQVGTGDCSPAAMSSFGSNATIMSQISKMENAACNPTICGDNGFSCGIFQINMTANPVICSDGQTLDCPSAFSAMYTGSNDAVAIENVDLARQCRLALQRPSCAIPTAQSLINTKTGLDHWTTYTKYIKK